MRCRRADVEAKRYEDLELVRHAAGLGTWRYVECRGMELRSSGGALQACRRGGEMHELWRHDVGVVRKRYGGMELWRHAVGEEVWRRAAGVQT